MENKTTDLFFVFKNSKGENFYYWGDPCDLDDGVQEELEFAIRTETEKLNILNITGLMSLFDPTNPRQTVH